MVFNASDWLAPRYWPSRTILAVVRLVALLNRLFTVATLRSLPSHGHMTFRSVRTVTFSLAIDTSQLNAPPFARRRSIFSFESHRAACPGSRQPLFSPPGGIDRPRHPVIPPIEGNVSIGAERAIRARTAIEITPSRYFESDGTESSRVQGVLCDRVTSGERHSLRRQQSADCGQSRSSSGAH